MNNEFKKITSKNETRYVLETASGVTSSAVVATKPSSIGELHRRLQELKNKVSQRNPVAQHAGSTTKSSAGSHYQGKDQKKQAKHGEEKHKKPFYEQMIEELDTLGELDKPWPGNVSDTELSNVDPEGHDEMEGSFVKNQIHTMLRVLKHLDHAIGDDEDLPEWVQMKLSQAQQTVVSVMDFMISDKELDVEKQTDDDVLMKEQGVAEIRSGEDRGKVAIRRGELRHELGHEVPSRQSSFSSQPTEIKRHYFIVPFADKDIAKSFGMRFDSNLKKWYKPQYTGGKTFSWQFDQELDQIKQRFKPYQEQGVEESKKRCPQCGMTNCTCAPGKCGCKPIAGWVPNKGFKKAKDEQNVAEVAGPKNCWPGHRKVGTQPGTGKNKGTPVNKCEKIKKEDVYIDRLMAALESKK